MNKSSILRLITSLVIWQALLSVTNAQGILIPAVGPVNRSMGGASVAAPIDAIGAISVPVGQHQHVGLSTRHCRSTVCHRLLQSTNNGGTSHAQWTRNDQYWNDISPGRICGWRLTQSSDNTVR